MPRAEGMKFAYEDHDTDYLNQSPPVQNTWYEVFHAYDVRLLWCVVLQSHTEAAALDVEIRWTIDGNVYFHDFAASNDTLYYIYRNHLASTGGTEGLTQSETVLNAGYKVDKRGLDFKVEVRLTSPPGTNQKLRCWCVRETLELT